MYHCLLPFSPVGVLRVWEASTARCVYAQTLNSTLAAVSEKEEEKDDDNDHCSLTYLLLLPASSRLATVTADHNIVLYQLPALTTQQQVCTQEGVDIFVPCFFFCFFRTTSIIKLQMPAAQCFFYYYYYSNLINGNPLCPLSHSLWDTMMKCWTWSFWVKGTATSWWQQTAASWRCLSCSPTAARSSTDTQVSNQERAARVHKYRHGTQRCMCSQSGQKV